jgi:glycosyltransferase involved in cell wall biosynthesis
MSKKLKILVVTQYFWPESFLINDLVKTLSEQGHHVVVATGKPNYPEGKIYDGYSAAGIKKERYCKNIEVIRAPLRARGKGGAKDLLLNYLSFVWNGLRSYPALLDEYEFDCILVYALSPITAAIPAIPVKWIKHTHLAIWVQDLWPQSLNATGFVKNRFLIGIVGWLVKAIYYFTDTILVQSHAFINPVKQYAREDKIIYYPNSFLDCSQKKENIPRLPEKLLSTFEHSFCLVFAGNLGRAQSVETLVSAAEKLKPLSNCKLILVGTGSMLSWIEQQKKLLGLNNLILAGRFPSSAMSHIYDKAEGLLVTLKKSEILSYTIPSKIQSYLAAGKPVVASLDGEGAKIINVAGAGLTCPAEDADCLAQNIEKLYNMSSIEREMYGKAGREYFLKNFEMKQQSVQLINILESRVNK